jgi:hypothetical protein
VERSETAGVCATRRQPLHTAYDRPMLRLDHVLLAVADLDAAASRILADHGLASVDGGEHVGLGTANRIVPLGETYIELIAVVDHAAAQRNPFGSYIGSFVADGDRLMAWAVATDEIDWDAKRIGASPVPATRVTPDGTELRWRMAGIEGALADRSLPFFIEWECGPEDHPGKQLAAHTCTPHGIADLEVAGSATKIRNRLGGATLPITVAKGDRAGPRSVTIATSDGHVVLT